MEANLATLEGLDVTGPKEQIRACNNVVSQAGHQVPTPHLGKANGFLVTYFNTLRQIPNISPSTLNKCYIKTQ